MAEYTRGRALPHLRAWRMRRFMGQTELAQAAGVAKSTLLRAERGDAVVSFANIRKLAQALGITPDALLDTPDAAPGDARRV